MSETAGFQPESDDRDTTSSLMERLRGGDNDAATALYLQYAKRIHRLARYQTSASVARQVAAEDVVQTVFRTFFRRVADGQYQAVEGDDLWRLLLVIALNKIRRAARFLHAQKRDLRRSETVDRGVLETMAGPANDDQVPLTVLRMTIDDLVIGMPDVFREVINLRIAGHTVNEIADLTGRAKRSVERMLQEFRNSLMGIVEECDREPD